MCERGMLRGRIIEHDKKFLSSSSHHQLNGFHLPPIKTMLASSLSIRKKVRHICEILIHTLKIPQLFDHGRQF